MRVLSLFAGIGGIDLAAQWAGMETVGFVEIDPFCQTVLRAHWPGVPIFGDICDVTTDTLRDAGISGVDCIVGGFPCQDVSLAGSRAGLAGERSTLWREYARLIREIGPRWVLAENVPGLLSANDGAFMAAVLRDLAAMGYAAGWGCWGAGDVGAGEPGGEWRRRSGDASSTLGDAERGGQQGEPRGRAGQESADGYGQTTGRAESGLGGTVDGFSAGVDGDRLHPAVAPPGSAQYAHEPTRTASGVLHRARRLKALGNAVDPYQVYPVLAAMMAMEVGDVTAG
jgi:DNA (cytosine-5)-methyltransferase 1